jgi:hypothetical protein
VEEAAARAIQPVLSALLAFSAFLASQSVP